jgi:RNA polymerase sigma-70 factor (ECF subfamily)
MFATAALHPKACCSEAAVVAAAVHPVEESYEARLLGEVARWNDQAAFEVLYARHVGAVTHAALHICGDRHVAEDIAQQTFTALWIRAGRLAAKTLRIRAWLCTVARNAAIDYLRTGSVALAALDAAANVRSNEPDPQQAALTAEAAHELHAALATLSPEQRCAVELFYFTGMTYRAVADMTGQPIGTIKSRVYLAVLHLRARMVR